MSDGSGAESYVFEPAEFAFDVGETVKFTISSEDEFHTFTVRELDIDMPVNARETQELWFSFDRRGTYRLVCIPHEVLGMTGSITVR